MLQALESQMQMPDVNELTFDDRFGVIVDAEMAARDSCQLQLRLKSAKLRQIACIEDLDYRSARGLDRSLLASLATCQWVVQHKNILIDGADWIGQKLHRLRPGPKSMSRWILCPVRTSAQAVRSSITSKGNRALH